MGSPAWTWQNQYFGLLWAPYLGWIDNACHVSPAKMSCNIGSEGMSPADTFIIDFQPQEFTAICCCYVDHPGCHGTGPWLFWPLDHPSRGSFSELLPVVN